MQEIFMRLISLCVLAAISEQMTDGTKLQDGVRLVCGLIAAQLMLEAALALPRAVFG